MQRLSLGPVSFALALVALYQSISIHLYLYPYPSIYPKNMTSQVGTYTELDSVGRQLEPYIKAGLYLPAPPLPHRVEAGFETHTASIQRRAVRCVDAAVAGSILVFRPTLEVDIGLFSLKMIFRFCPVFDRLRALPSRTADHQSPVLQGWIET